MTEVPGVTVTLTCGGCREQTGESPDVQMVLQDPVSSLNPRRSVGESIADPLRARGMGVPPLERSREWSRVEGRIRGRVRELLERVERVGLEGVHYDRYPHEFSGGERQRVGIARVAVMRRGRIVEYGPADEVYESPQDPYRKQLLAAVPALDPDVATQRRTVRRALAAV